MRALSCTLWVLMGCNSLTGASELDPVDCLGDCRVGPGVFWCGAGSCKTGEVCCASANCDLDGDGGSSGCACTTAASCAGPKAALACDGPEDCGSLACCAMVVAKTTSPCAIEVTGSTCQPSCEVAIVCKSQPTRLCHKSSDCGPGNRCCKIATNIGNVFMCAQAGFASTYECVR